MARTRVRNLLVLAPAALAVALVAGCSGSVNIGGNKLDETKLEDTIESDLSNAVDSGTAVSVDCPADVEIKAGATSECTAMIGSQALIYKVEQTDDEGNVTYTRTKAVLDLDKAEASVTEQLTEQVPGTWKMSCTPAGDERIYVIAVGGTFTCGVEGTNEDGETQSADVILTVKDLEGNVDWKAQS